MSDLDGIQVVLIDDDEDEYILTRDLLEDCQGKPFSLSWVHSYPKALEVVRQGEGDVYLIDFRLGQHSGLDLLREVKASGCDRAMIMLTGQGDVEVDREAMALGASDYLVKGDFTGSILERAIRYALERQRTQSELRRHSAILSNVHDAVFYVDEDAIIRDWNLGAERIFREKSEDVVGSTVMEVCPNRGGGPHPFLEQIEPAVLREGMAEQVVQFQLRCGRVIHVQVKARQMVQDGRRGMVICASDITEQKRLEAEILRVAESEQRRIGQDLHDDLSSQLSGIGCLTKALENRLRQSHEEEAALLEEITKMVSSAGERTRQIAKGLLPAALETHGIKMALQELAGQFQSMFGLPCRARVEDPGLLDELDEGTRIHLYRMVQEALNNAMKHSDASEVSISLAVVDEKVVLAVKDNGKGMTRMNPESLGLGLLTMRRRAEMIGGVLELETGPESGTMVRCRFPFQGGRSDG